MKICPKCSLSSLRKFGKRNRKQRFQCKNCKAIIGGSVVKKVDYDDLYDLFCFSNRTYQQLAKEFDATTRTIQSRLDNAVFKKRIFQSADQ